MQPFWNNQTCKHNSLVNSSLTLKLIPICLKNDGNKWMERTQIYQGIPKPKFKTIKSDVSGIPGARKGFTAVSQTPQPCDSATRQMLCPQRRYDNSWTGLARCFNDGNRHEGGYLTKIQNGISLRILLSAAPCGAGREERHNQPS
jgi:hypothetical protein